MAVVAFFADGNFWHVEQVLSIQTPSPLPSIVEELWPMTCYDSGLHAGIHTPVDRADGTFCENNHIRSFSVSQHTRLWGNIVRDSNHSELIDSLIEDRKHKP